MTGASKTASNGVPMSTKLSGDNSHECTVINSKQDQFVFPSKLRNGFIICENDDDLSVPFVPADRSVVNVKENNNSFVSNGVVHAPNPADALELKVGTAFHADIVWKNVILFILLHLGALYGFVLMLTAAKLYTNIWAVFVHIAGGLGITAGAHRLWTHRSYKATTPLKIILMLCNCTAMQNDIIEWSRDHRVHHKFSETNADPHNATRGLFFSHMGWLMCKKHPDVARRGKTVDISDLTSDPVLLWQRRYYYLLIFLMCFVVPSVIPWLFWNESLFVAFYVAGLLRYCFTLHMTWTVNSLAHMFGYRPYDKYINPRESYASTIATLGEGWHNYHHSFPHDYRASEFPWRVNLTTMFIDMWAALGLAYDRKVISQQMIDRKKQRCGE